MKNLLKLAVLALAVTFPPLESAMAADGANWKVGRVYNRLVCNACHRLDGGHVVSPYERTKAEWKSYYLADSHAAAVPTEAKVNPSARYYMSQSYRLSIKDSNQAAAKFLQISDDEMAAHVIEFYVRGAKDSDTPARCQ